MDYYGLLFLYYLKGLSGKSILRLFFNIETDGTEQLLPENASTPTTTPILADIQYPDGLRADQYFTYRETPTTVSNKARIKTIKGNTLVWNQLVQNGNFENTSGWSAVRGTISASSNVLSYTVDVLGGGGLQNRILRSVAIPAGHKVYISMSIKATKPFVFLADANGEFYLKNPITANEWNLCQAIRTISTGMENLVFGCPSTIGDMAVGDVIQFKDVMLVDLTKMGLDYITDPSEFTSIFSLPYYAYNQGALLSFNGEQIKTVGKNLFDFSQFANGTITFENGVLTGTAAQFYTSYRDVVNAGIELKYPKNTQITISFDARTEQNQSPSGGGVYLSASENGISVQLATTLNSTTAIQHITVTIPSDRHIDKLGWTYGSSTQNIWHITNFQIEFGATETSYEPYTESIADLPISQYFPTGMKSAGSVYDELTETKAITRIGAVDLGTLSWSYVSANRRFVAIISDAKSSSSLTVLENIVCAKYENATWEKILTNAKDKIIALHYTSNNSYVAVIDNDYSSASTFKTAMSGVYLYYELRTPLENYGVVDLGEMTWLYSGTLNYFYTTISDMKSGTQNALCDKCSNSMASSISQVADKQFMIYENEFRIKDSAYTTTDAFTTAMSGVYLLYEKGSTETTPEEANNALSLLMGRSVSSSNANQLIDIITKGE